MPYKDLASRREHYKKNKDKINARRREYRKRPEVNERENKRNLEWRHNNLERAREITNKAKKVYEDKCKKEVYEHYGKKCACCGEDNLAFLSIDHVNGGGTKHRKKIGRKINVWLYRNNFPDGFQTLCFNCNWAKHNNNGICPHKQNN